MCCHGNPGVNLRVDNELCVIIQRIYKCLVGESEHEKMFLCRQTCLIKHFLVIQTSFGHHRLPEWSRFTFFFFKWISVMEPF